jgi:hypothetical protein
VGGGRHTTARSQVSLVFCGGLRLELLLLNLAQCQRAVTGRDRRPLERLLEVMLQGVEVLRRVPQAPRTA